MNNQKLELIRQKCIEAHGECEHPINAGARCQFGCCQNRPIRLADVLLAIEPGIYLDVSGGFFKHDARGVRIYFAIWNLRKDDLNSQSEETIDFLAGVLT